MPVKHRSKQRVPVDLEMPIMNQLMTITEHLGIPRTTLIRILIKYGLAHIHEAVAYGDRLSYTLPTDISSLQPPLTKDTD